ncbi:MAG: hypothetical protein ACD_12C00344G0001 [uncultured bacterium]|nr:MAG: hypothetical protein ACD_12C00344G0001 [uncultured bacterium]
MKDNLTLSIAGFNIQVNLEPTEWKFAKKIKEKEIRKYWKGFIINQPKKIDFEINFIEKSYLDIIYKKKERKQYMGFFEEKNNEQIDSFYQISIFQFQVILRHIINKLLAGKGFILHGSASNIRGQAFLFTGVNGAGKSTTMKLLSSKYIALADDTVIIKKENNKYFLYQTPYVEKEWWIKKNSQRHPLGKVFFIKKEKYFKEEIITNKALLFNKIIEQLWTEDDEYTQKKTRLVYRFVYQFNDFYYLLILKNKKKLLNFIQ